MSGLAQRITTAFCEQCDGGSNGYLYRPIVIASTCRHPEIFHVRHDSWCLHDDSGCVQIQRESPFCHLLDILSRSSRCERIVRDRVKALFVFAGLLDMDVKWSIPITVTQVLYPRRRRQAQRGLSFLFDLISSAKSRQSSSLCTTGAATIVASGLIWVCRRRALGYT